MDFSFSKEKNVGIYSLKGSLIGESDGMAINDSFAEQIENGILKFIIDLSELKHVNSSGLGVFITLLTKARKKGGELVLTSPSDYIQNLFLITKLNTIFTVHDSVEEAIEKI